MFLKTVRAIAKPQVVAILDVVKRSTGMSVSEISKALNMSYMGIKQHCVDLEKKGLLDTWRRPKDIGRPEKTYRLTDKAQSLFPQVGIELTLDILQTIGQLYGPTAPEKLLFNYFSKKVDEYLKKIPAGSTPERAAAFVRLREMEGYCSQIEVDTRFGFRIVEFHNPLAELMEKYPSVHRMEEAMISKILGSPLVRSEEHASGLSKYSFTPITAFAPPIPVLGQDEHVALSN